MTAMHSSIHFGGMPLGNYRHICAFFNTPEEEYRALLPFISEGIKTGDRAFHVLDPELLGEHFRRMQAVGIDTEAAQRRGQLEVSGWENVYLRGGHFDQDRMLAMVEEILQGGQDRGYELTRMVAHAEWAMEDMPGVNEFIEYEARLNHILPKYKDPVVCVYDCAKLGAGLVMDAMRTHPMVIIGGVLQENSFFLPPDEFLIELRERDAYRRRAVA